MDTDVRIARLQTYFEADPANADLACELADALSVAGRPQDALKTLETLPLAAAETAGVGFRRMRIALLQGDYAAAERAGSALLAAGTDAPAIRHDLAFSLLCLRRPEQAEIQLASALQRFGPEPPLVLLRSRIALMQERYDDAIAFAHEAIALDSGEPSSHGVLALALFDASRFDEAAAAAARAQSLDPDQHEALLVAGTLALWRQDLDLAQDAFERALRRHSGSGRALSGLGQLLMLRNQVPQACEVLERATQAMPDHIGTWHALAWSQLLDGRRDAAEASYRSAYALDRNFADTHGGLALIDALRGNYDLAEQGIKRALRLDPQAITARYAQTLVLDARGQREASRAVMDDLLRSGTSVAAPMPVEEFAARLKRLLDAKPA